MDNYVKRNISKLAPPSHPPYLYSDYQDSAVLVLVTWDQKENEPNLLETVLWPKKGFHEVGPPSKNNLRYLSLPRLSGFTGASSDYLGSFGKRDQPFRNFFTAKKSSREVGSPSQNNLRYLSLPRLIWFTSACRAIKPKQVKPKKVQLMKKKALKRRKLID